MNSSQSRRIKQVSFQSDPALKKTIKFVDDLYYYPEVIMYRRRSLRVNLHRLSIQTGNNKENDANSSNQG